MKEASAGQGDGRSAVLRRRSASPRRGDSPGRRRRSPSPLKRRSFDDRDRRRSRHHDCNALGPDPGKGAGETGAEIIAAEAEIGGAAAEIDGGKVQAGTGGVTGSR
eukprot:756974-Hanusia_phi.AAC.2